MVIPLDQNDSINPDKKPLTAQADIPYGEQSEGLNLSEPHQSLRQYTLFEPDIVPDYRLDAFVTSQATQTVLSTARAWVSSDEPMLIICGAAAAGKSHLAHCVMELAVDNSRADNNSVYVSGVRDGVRAVTDRFGVDSPQLIDVDKNNHGRRLLVVDPVRITGHTPNHPDHPLAVSPRELLDLIEACRNHMIRLVLVGRDTPSVWAGELADLKTRLEAMNRISIPTPDEDLICNVIARHLRARQLAIAPEEMSKIATYAASMIPGTFEAAAMFARALDMASLEEKRKPARSLAGLVIERYFS